MKADAFAGVRAALAELVFCYADRLDRGDLEGVAKLFERASYGIEGTQPLEGAEALLEAMRHMVVLYEDGTPRTKHVTTNLVFDIAPDGTSARVRSYFTVLQATDGFPLQTILAGRYADSFARDGSGWYFTGRSLEIDLRGDVSRHLRQALD